VKKRILAAALAALLAIGCTGCGAPLLMGRVLEEDAAHQDNQVPHYGGTTTTEPEPTADPEPVTPVEAEGLSLTVERETGEMTITRPEGEETPMGEEGTWTVFVYLCGTDLESDGWGMASGDLEEMREAAGSSRVRFVVETGGARSWEDWDVSSRTNQRFLIENGEMTLVDEVSRSGMGRPSTLADFLTWGVENYPAARMGVILWNHGGGSISGVCFDEMDNYDSLSLRELDEALATVRASMTDKFEFFGFDACLMGTLEVANILASYARYMIASQELEPGSGWDYVSLGSTLAGDPYMDGEELGRTICDAYYADCQRYRCESEATLSLVDLREIDDVVVAFNTFAGNMYTVSEDSAVLAEMIRGIEAAENFGGNNRIEGYTNMVDLGGLLSACRSYAEGASLVLAKLNNAVVYNVRGSSHRYASGLSLYYPLCIQGSQEMSIFSDICPSPYYLSFVDRQGYGSVNDGSVDDYSDDYWYEDDYWDWSTGYDDSYWDYIDDFQQTGESSLIQFWDAPQLDEDGYYWFSLTDESIDYTSSVLGNVYEFYANQGVLIELGETCDVHQDWENGVFWDYFDGYWLSLPDGQNLALYLVEIGEDYILYTSPIYLNGEETYLRLRQNYDGSVTVEGAWNGIDEYGASDREIVQIQDGDVIKPIYYAYSIYDFEELRYVGYEYTVQGETWVGYDLMENGDYLYAFCINDIYGDYLLTDYTLFTVEDDGLYFHSSWTMDDLYTWDGYYWN